MDFSNSGQQSELLLFHQKQWKRRNKLSLQLRLVHSTLSIICSYFHFSRRYTPNRTPLHRKRCFADKELPTILCDWADPFLLSGLGHHVNLLGITISVIAVSPAAGWLAWRNIIDSTVVSLCGLPIDPPAACITTIGLTVEAEEGFYWKLLILFRCGLFVPHLFCGQKSLMISHNAFLSASLIYIL